ncbi:MAG: RsmD family RNA methyltransferase [Victivallaceae bacterium]|nr:RsmD family RNA methyltransferase [Victivallaceae bacterium]
MNIISGTAKSIELAVPPGLTVRPTSARARKALFDSLGDFTGANVVDLFAGCGSLGLEAASRGAARVVMVEKSRTNCTAIEENTAKVRKAGVDSEIIVIPADVMNGTYCTKAPQPDIIFADPPYPESIEYFEKLMADKRFVEWAQSSYLIWEIPSEPGAVGKFMDHPELISKIKRFGSTQFLVAVVEKK